ncbi:uncharacterized protein ISCGN_015848 [Ixodes scapularis]
MSCPKQPTSEFDPGEFFQAAVFLSKMTLLRLRLRVLGYSIRKKVPHGSIKQIMGFHSSNWQANHRVMQIARDEISNELRVMQQLLPSVMCGHLGPNYDRHAAFRFLQESASTLLSDSWNHFLRHLRNGGDVSTKAQPEPPINLSGVTLSPATESLLAHGPKFAPPVNSSRDDELASVYEIAAKIPEDSRQDFVGAGTRGVCFHGGSRRAKNASTPVIKELQAGELSLLQADKTGQFVILNKQQMQEKSDEALKKNFIGLKTRPSGSLRSRVKAMCDSSNLPSLKSAVLAPAKQYLSIFFSAKTHKPGVPFRSIVSETGCWQRPLAKFLQKHLGTLELPQPFRLRNSEDLLPVLDELHAGTEAVRAFSLDVVDLYYSLNVKTLLGFISDAIHETGPSGKGQRLIVTHIGSDEGFVDDCLDVFRGQKTGDYHEEMDGARFEKWFDGVLDKLPTGSVIVMDNASYHSRRLEAVPTTSSRNDDIRQWLTSKKISWVPRMVKKQLLDIVALVKPQHLKYRVDTAAETAGCTVVRLPPYHCEFNPIELIWAQIKNGVAARNTTFKIVDVGRLLNEEVDKVTTDNWINAVRHVIDIEATFRRGGATSAHIQPIVIQLDGEDTPSESDLSGVEPLDEA